MWACRTCTSLWPTSAAAVASSPDPSSQRSPEAGLGGERGVPRRERHRVALWTQLYGRRAQSRRSHGRPNRRRPEVVSDRRARSPRVGSVGVLGAVQVSHRVYVLLRALCKSRHHPGGASVHARPELGCQSMGLPGRPRREHSAHEREPLANVCRWPGRLVRRRAEAVWRVRCCVGHTVNVTAHLPPTEGGRPGGHWKERKEPLPLTSEVAMPKFGAGLVRAVIRPRRT